MQLLLYIWEEGGVDKSWVVNRIKLEFSLFFQRADLVLAILAGAVVSNIEQSTIYMYLGIGVRNN